MHGTKPPRRKAGNFMKTKIIIGADLVPTKSNYKLFELGDVEELVGKELLEKLHGADFTVFNLEVPLADEPHPIVKYGPNLIAPTSMIAGLKAINPHFLGLANNHVLDQGVEGLKSTIAALKHAGIEYSGVGQNLKEAHTPFIREIGGKKIGVYCCAEHEFSIATDFLPGVNPFDPLESLDHVEQLKNAVDYVIVLYHGGKEHYRYPSPGLQKVCRRLVDKGADLVVCQHSYCVGCEEKYGHGTIVYGQGNFLFDDGDNEFWQTGLLIELDDDFEISYVPIVKAGNGVRLADDKRCQEILENFYKRSREIKKPGFIQAQYDEFADVFFPNYINTIKGKETLLFKIINKLSGNALRKKSIQNKFDTRHLAALWNYMDCEAHHELLLRGIQRKIMENDAL